MLLIPLPEACKLKKPVQDLIMEARAPFSIFLAGMRTLTQQVYEDHAAACSRAAEQTDDPVFRRMLLMLWLHRKLAAQEESSVGRFDMTENMYCSELQKGYGSLCLPID